MKKKVLKKTITTENLHNKLKTLVTKKEFSQYRNEASKELTKIRIEMATKEELNNLADTVGKIANRLVNVEQGVDNIVENMVIKEEHNKVMEFLDKILKNIETLNQERVITNEQLGRLETDVEQLKIKAGI